MSVTIRSVTQADKEIWQRLFDEYAAFYNTAIPNDGHDAVWNWIFDTSEKFWCSVAVADDDSLIGFTQFQLMHRSLGGTKVCYLSDLYVRPEIRGTGAGRALIDHVFAFAKAHKITNVRWLTQDSNAEARRLYDSYMPKSDFILYSIPVEAS
ncbi:MAG: GNAT family N-acetyltransferase [Hyphomicrobiales bacterium]